MYYLIVTLSDIFSYMGKVNMIDLHIPFDDMTADSQQSDQHRNMMRILCLRHSKNDPSRSLM